MREALTEAGLAADAIERALGYWGVSPAGNFEGKEHPARPAGGQRPAGRAC